MKSCSLSVRIAAPVHFLVPCCMLSLEWAGGCTWGKSCFPSPPDEMLMAESDGPPAGVPQLHPPIAAPQFRLLFFPPDEKWGTDSSQLEQPGERRSFLQTCMASEATCSCFPIYPACLLSLCSPSSVQKLLHGSKAQLHTSWHGASSEGCVCQMHYKGQETPFCQGLSRGHFSSPSAQRWMARLPDRLVRVNRCLKAC